MRPTLYLSSLLCLILLLIACSDGSDRSVEPNPYAASSPSQDNPSLKVMHQYVVIGASHSDGLAAQTIEELFDIIVDIHAKTLASEPEARINHVADQIAAELPDIVSLQGLTRVEATGPATGVDMPATMIQALAARGLNYTVAYAQPFYTMGTFPLLYPMCAVAEPVGACTVNSSTQDNIILVNSDNTDLTVSNAMGADWASQWIITVFGQPINFHRGWASIDGTIGDRDFRFIAAHFERTPTFDHQAEQAQELLALTAYYEGALIVSTNTNSESDELSSTAYPLLTEAGFRDVYGGQEPGKTCCQPNELTNPVSQLSRNDDSLLVHGAFGFGARLVNDEPFQTVYPFWASNHAGIVATVHIPRPGFVDFLNRLAN